MWPVFTNVYITNRVFVCMLTTKEENILNNIIINVVSLFARCESTMSGCINTPWHYAKMSWKHPGIYFKLHK